MIEINVYLGVQMYQLSYHICVIVFLVSKLYMPENDPFKPASVFNKNIFDELLKSHRQIDMSIT